MSDRLRAAQAKVNRTHGQFEELASEIAAFCETRPYRMTFVPDIETGDQIVSVELAPITKAIEWGVRIGEIVHNLRSALEHVVWQAIEANGNIPSPGITGFPLCTSQSEFDSPRTKRMINGVSDEVRTLIYEFQPLHQTQKEGDPKAHILYVLNELWNIDKHRLLHVCSTIANVSVDDVRSEGRIRIENLVIREAGRIDRKAEIARYRLVEDLPVQGKVQVDAKITYDIALDESGPSITHGAPVRVAIPIFARYVAATLDKFSAVIDQAGGDLTVALS
ncbi:MAG: hypothetical protein WCL53_08030 [Chloroflexota bacterium]